MNFLLLKNATIFSLYIISTITITMDNELNKTLDTTQYKNITLPPKVDYAPYYTIVIIILLLSCASISSTFMSLIYLIRSK